MFNVLHSIFEVTSVISSDSDYSNNTETPIIFYKYNQPIRSNIFNLKKIFTDMNTPNSWDCQNYIYSYPPAGHVMTGNLKVIPDSRVRNIISKDHIY